MRCSTCGKETYKCEKCGYDTAYCANCNRAKLARYHRCPECGSAFNFNQNNYTLQLLEKQRGKVKKYERNRFALASFVSGLVALFLSIAVIVCMIVGNQSFVWTIASSSCLILVCIFVICFAITGVSDSVSKKLKGNRLSYVGIAFGIIGVVAAFINFFVGF